MKCVSCGSELSDYDVGFYKKLVNRGSTEYACIPCTCGRFRISEEKAWEMIRNFRQTGCSLFPPLDKE